jgi:5-methylcytosine-specific restriction endonuclease McrA
MNCLCCGFETKNPKFCSKSCAAKHNNKIVPKRAVEGLCDSCRAPITKSRKYCSKCWDTRYQDRASEKVNSWLSGESVGGSSRKLKRAIRDFLLKQSNYECSKCGFNKTHPVDGRTVLEINHIDGNPTNHTPKNLEVLCPNCHALTDSYRGRNRGNGRPVYYLRVEK